MSDNAESRATDPGASHRTDSRPGAAPRARRPGLSQMKEQIRVLEAHNAQLQRAEQVLTTRERRLRASEARSAAILAAVTEGVVTIGADGRIETINAAAERLFGYREGELRGQDVRVLMPDTWATETCGKRDLAGGAGLVRRSGHPIEGRRKDGTVVPLALECTEWGDGDDRRFAAVVTDMTAGLEREAALAESEARFRQIADHVSDAFVIYDRRSHTVIYASPALEVIFGQSAAQLAPARNAWLHWVHPDDRAAVAARVAAIREGRPFDGTFRILRPDGEIRWIALLSFPVDEADGEVTRDIATVRDVTEQRVLQEALDHAQRIEAIGEMASGLAHDFGNLLQGVLGCLTLARAEAVPPDRAREMLDRAASAARNGAELATRVMRFSRRETATPVLLDLDALLADQVPLLERLLTERIAVVFEPGATGARTQADPIQLQQLLLNLATNSRDAMPDGGTLRITTDMVVTDQVQPSRTGAMQPGPWVRMVVADNGCGMPPEVARRMFEPFYTTKQAGSGTGLGLSSVFASTQQAGGHVDVHTAPGAGTRFTFHLPWVGGELFSSESPHPRVRFEGVAMLVDDDDLVRVVVRHYLEDLGFEVVEASHPGTALERLDALGHIDLLVTDVNLPLIPGPELARLIGRHVADLAVLFITASPELVGEPPAALKTDVLLKPFEPPELAERIAALLEIEGMPA